jgi:hypothetical protein
VPHRQLKCDKGYIGPTLTQVAELLHDSLEDAPKANPDVPNPRDLGFGNINCFGDKVTPAVIAKEDSEDYLND